jgi:penicillin-binding protein 1C
MKKRNERRYRIRIALCVLCVSVASFPWLWLRTGPLPQGLLDLERHVSTEIVDRHGAAVYEALSGRGLRSRFVPADELPERLVQATLAAEDARFFRHAGVDPWAIARAVLHDVRALRLREGGSTITQQVAKLLIDRPRSVRGKLHELVVALRLEHRLGKRDILALYLSLAPYGNQLVGARAASEAYFGCRPENLTAAQAALLAGLPQRPTALDPRRNLEAARQRQQWVLTRMGELGMLRPDELERARAERLHVLPGGRDLLAPHFVDRVRASLAGSPRRVETTLDLELQARVRGIVERHRDRLAEHGAYNVAVVVLDNARGEWLAWEGSGAYFDPDHGGAIDGVVAARQPGSALKPFTYALAFEHGFTPASVLPDIPSHFPTAEPGVLYSPRNYDGRFRGPLRARLALAGSQNVPAVWLLSQVGVPDLLRLLRRGGFSTLERTADYYGYALTMGDAEVRLDELAAAYSALARGGLFRPPRLVRSVTRADGRVEEPLAPAERRILSERAAFWATDVLSDPHARAWAFGAGGSLDFPFPVAVKTGTSQSDRDNWTLGFTRAVTVGVWVGNFDRRELRNSSGVTGAAPIFHDVLLAAEAHVAGRLPEGADALAAPATGLQATRICALSGRRAGEWCPAVEREWLPGDSAPGACAWHRPAGGRVAVTYPAAYRAFAPALGLPDHVALPARHIEAGAFAPRAVASHVAVDDVRLRIVNPPAGAVYLRDPTLRPAFQSVPLRASGARPGRLRWEVDGTAVGHSHPEGALDWPLRAGTHTIVVTDVQGRQDRATIVVR